MTIQTVYACILDTPMDFFPSTNYERKISHQNNHVLLRTPSPSHHFFTILAGLPRLGKSFFTHYLIHHLQCLPPSFILFFSLNIICDLTILTICPSLITLHIIIIMTTTLPCTAKMTLCDMVPLIVRANHHQQQQNQHKTTQPNNNNTFNATDDDDGIFLVPSLQNDFERRPWHQALLAEALKIIADNDDDQELGDHNSGFYQDNNGRTIMDPTDSMLLLAGQPQQSWCTFDAAKNGQNKIYESNCSNPSLVFVMRYIHVMFLWKMTDCSVLP